MDAAAVSFDELRKELDAYLAPDKVDLIYQAYRVAADAHAGQQRQTGDPFISHPIAVARLLAGMHMDHQSIMAAMLHDVIEDTLIEKHVLLEKFGEEVAELVDGVTKLTLITFESRAEAQAENFRKMVLAMARDIRVILVKLADRLHNMRTLSALPAHKRRRIARETLEIYAPIANRLGMHNFRVEFEDLGFAALYPMRYRVLKEAVQKMRGNRKEVVNVIKAALKTAVEEQGLPSSAVIGRQKHLYSIYKKMQSKHLSLSEIMDFYAFRVVVDKVDTCYRVLGAVHNLYKPFTDRFKDYIAIPKSNGYQSLHTTLFGPYGLPIEIQIRTAEMDYLADNGIAAHWLYKSQEGEVSIAELRAREWLKGLLDLQKGTGNSLEFIENVKIDLFPDEVYVFTPKGSIMELPSGATAVDFAYAVHSDIGDSCIAAKIDRRLAPLSTLLANGQTVEIVTGKGATPNPAWLNFVVSGKARSGIRHFLKNQRRAQSVELGKQLLANALMTLSSSWELVDKKQFAVLAESLHYKTLDDLCEAVGLGHQMPMLMACRLLGVKIPKAASKTTEPLAIKGTAGTVVQFAECCRPIPGDPIVGYLHQGHGIVVHVEQCKEVIPLAKQTGKLISVCWEDDVIGEFRVDLQVDLANQRGVLAQLATVVAAAESNIDNINIERSDVQHSIVNLTLSVRDRTHLARVLRRIRSLKVVLKIVRKKL
jgi:guanosine-3',5'-bis(diphosphate) 3'-pyrophosphohydrolase